MVFAELGESEIFRDEGAVQRIGRFVRNLYCSILWFVESDATLCGINLTILDYTVTEIFPYCVWKLRSQISKITGLTPVFFHTDDKSILLQHFQTNKPFFFILLITKFDSLIDRRVDSSRPFQFFSIVLAEGYNEMQRFQGDWDGQDKIDEAIVGVEDEFNQYLADFDGAVGQGEEDEVIVVGLIGLRLLLFKGSIFEQLNVLYLQPFQLVPVLLLEQSLYFFVDFVEIMMFLLQLFLRVISISLYLCTIIHIYFIFTIFRNFILLN